jgi:hypothetical protein
MMDDYGKGKMDCKSDKSKAGNSTGGGKPAPTGSNLEMGVSSSTKITGSPKEDGMARKGKQQVPMGQPKKAVKSGMRFR